jgi:hypothetical protein
MGVIEPAVAAPCLLGLLDNGSVATTWFSDSGGHVKQMVRNQPQRDALATFLTDALGDQTAPVTNDPTVHPDPETKWIPSLGLSLAGVSEGSAPRNV